MPAFKKRVTHSLGSLASPGAFGDFPVGNIDACGAGWWTRQHTFMALASDYTDVWLAGGTGAGTPAILATGSISPSMLSVPTTAVSGAETVIYPANATNSTSGLGISMGTLSNLRRAELIRATVTMTSSSITDAEVFVGLADFNAAATAVFSGGTFFSLGFYKPATSTTFNIISNLAASATILSLVPVLASSVATMPALSETVTRLDLGVYIQHEGGSAANIAFFVGDTCVKALASTPMTTSSVLLQPMFAIQNAGSTLRSFQIASILHGIKIG